MTTLVLNGVTKVRGAGRHVVEALAGVNLRLEPGEVVLLQGPSGSGKTTLLAVAAGLLTPDQGEVLIVGRALQRETASGRRRIRSEQVGFVFQRSNLLPALTGLENVLLQAWLAGMLPAQARRRARELLEALCVAHLSGRLPQELSAGEEQRFAVARALVHGPALVLADEPTASLDASSGQGVLRQLVGLARARDTAVLIATHDPRLEGQGDQRVRILDGRIERA